MISARLEHTVTVFPILHVAEMWKPGHNNLIRDALVFIPFRIEEIIGGTDVVDLGDFR